MNYIKQLLTLLRYRFFLFAGIFPYLLGFAVAYHQKQPFSPDYFFMGAVGLILVFIGVETFNEYFDYKYGGDRIFALSLTVIPEYVLWIGIASFILAGCISLYLSLKLGIAILVFAGLGFLAAVFYVGPPLRLVYRGFGEAAIFLCYGPLMTMGSYYLFTQQINPKIFWISLIPGVLIFALCLVNEIPDFYQDRLVGKKNIVVRIGKEKTAILYQLTLLACLGLVSILLILGELPPLSILDLLLVPIFIKNGMLVKKYAESPLRFTAAIRGTILLYTGILGITIIGYLI